MRGTGSRGRGGRVGKGSRRARPGVRENRSSDARQGASAKGAHPLRWIPNALTTVRLVLLVPFAYLLVAGRYHAAGIVYLVALLTDLDGAIARRYGWTSRFGAVYDPTVDGLYLVVGSVLLLGAGLLPLVPLAAYLVSALFRLLPSLVHLRTTRTVQSTVVSKATAFCGYGAIILATFGVPGIVTGSVLLLGAVLNTAITVSWIRKGRFVLKA